MAEPLLMPSEQLEEVKTLRDAQLLYAKLGRYLSGEHRSGRTRAVYQQQGWRTQAKAARRKLEQFFGDAVRLTSASRTYSTVGAAGGPMAIMPTWSKRRHFTIAKPKLMSPPYLMYVLLNTDTREPRGVFYNHADALRAYMRMPAKHGRGISQEVSERVQLQEQLSVVEKELQQLEVLRSRLRAALGRR